MDIVIDHNGDPAEIFLEYICAKAQLSHSEFPKVKNNVNTHYSRLLPYNIEIL